MRIVYHYDPSTRALTDVSSAAPSPLEPDVYLIAAHATIVAPPRLPGAGEAAVFDPAAGAWEIVPDLRGRTAWLKSTGEAVRIARPGALPPELTLTPPAPGSAWDEADGAWELTEAGRAALLEAARAQALAKLADRRWRAETGGIVFGGVAVATDRESQALISGAWIGAQIDPGQVIEWKGVGGWMTLDAAAIAAVGLAVRNHVQACFSLEKVKAGEIEALETVEAVEAWLATELEAGWPG